MVFESAEIRWFSNDKDTLWQIFTKLPEAGNGIAQEPRTDHYLNCKLVNSGIKVREGNHEIKLRSQKDVQTEFGPVERWTKWSTPESRNALNTIDSHLLDEWLVLHKSRNIKYYKVESSVAMSSDGGDAVEGCNAEFTRVHIDSHNQTLFTLGIEAYSKSNRHLANLMAVLRLLVPWKERLEGLSRCSYPVMLKDLLQ